MGIIALVLLLSAIGGALGGKSGNDESGSASLNATESQVAAFFKSQGLDNIHTAAIMGNMYAESGMNPRASRPAARVSASASGQPGAPPTCAATPHRRVRRGPTSASSSTSSGTTTSGRPIGAAAIPSPSINSTGTPPSGIPSAAPSPGSWTPTTSPRPSRSSAMAGSAPASPHERPSGSRPALLRRARRRRWRAGL